MPGFRHVCGSAEVVVLLAKGISDLFVEDVQLSRHDPNVWNLLMPLAAFRQRFSVLVHILAIRDMPTGEAAVETSRAHPKSLKDGAIRRDLRELAGIESIQIMVLGTPRLPHRAVALVEVRQPGTKLLGRNLLHGCDILSSLLALVHATIFLLLLRRRLGGSLCRGSCLLGLWYEEVWVNGRLAASDSGIDALTPRLFLTLCCHG
mmetsp:Transcript_28930/g.68154  ORF Transcript_28930/g.68154 Transcript_28930/m.68154 type:complete len:205 (+) Transcript_28930:423-1037(+)